MSPEPVGGKWLPPQAREPLQTIIPAGHKPYTEDSGREDPGGGDATMQGAVDLAAPWQVPHGAMERFIDVVRNS
jgi:hypothetical protein